MLILLEALRAAVFAALPIACFTFLTVQWSIVSGRLPRFSDKKDLQAKFEKIRNDAKEAKKKAKQNKLAGQTPQEETPPFFHKRKGGDILYGKLLFFGGGFYGTMALFTYMIIEVEEILSFFGKIINVTHWQFTFSIHFLIDLFINSIMNIVAAFIWFQTLPKYVDVNNGFIWIAVAYLGYLGGIQFTKLKGDQAWQLLSTGLQTIKSKLREK